MAGAATISDALHAAVAAHKAGDLDAAERGYRAVLAAAPDDANALNLLGLVAQARGEWATAEILGDRARRLMPESPVFLASHGVALAALGRTGDAIAAFQAALTRRPADATTWRNLGIALAANGDHVGSLKAMEFAVRHAPEDAAAHLGRAHALRELGRLAEAAEAARLATRARDPALAEQARFVLAALEGTGAERAPPAYVQALFDQFAPRFDAELERLGYRTPRLLADLLQAGGVVPERMLRVLDIGCGTGLSGYAMVPFARVLAGVDLSPRMIEAARARKVYDTLEVADLMETLARAPEAWDLIVAADVLNYVGALEAPLAAMAAALAPGGHAAISLETGEAPLELAGTLRFRHAPAHAAALARAAGLTVAREAPAVLRQERGRPVAGTLMLLRKDGSGSA
jgi:predicted TPR repeat methyltransferase